jgi:ArsR family transcriptional regulator
MDALMGKSINTVVTGEMGGRAVGKLNEGGIKVYRAIPGTVTDIVNQFTKSGLEEITIDNACSQHGCH